MGWFGESKGDRREAVALSSGPGEAGASGSVSHPDRRGSIPPWSTYLGRSGKTLGRPISFRAYRLGVNGQINFFKFIEQGLGVAIGWQFRHFCPVFPKEAAVSLRSMRPQPKTRASRSTI